MSASTSGICTEWEDLPADGSQAWIGWLLIAASGFISVQTLAWVGGTICRLVMR